MPTPSKTKPWYAGTLAFLRRKWVVISLVSIAAISVLLFVVYLAFGRHGTTGTSGTAHTGHSAATHGTDTSSLVDRIVSAGNGWFPILLLGALVWFVIWLFTRRKNSRDASNKEAPDSKDSSAHTDTPAAKKQDDHKSDDKKHDDHGGHHREAGTQKDLIWWSLAVLAAVVAIGVVVWGVNWMSHNESMAPPPVPNPTASAEMTRRLHEAPTETPASPPAHSRVATCTARHAGFTPRSADVTQGSPQIIALHNGYDLCLDPGAEFTLECTYDTDPATASWEPWTTECGQLGRYDRLTPKASEGHHLDWWWDDSNGQPRLFY